MGKAARVKGKAATPPQGQRAISLRDTPAEYWQLRARAADVQRAEQLAQQAGQAVMVARHALREQLLALGEKHGFTAIEVEFQCDDATLALTISPIG